MIKYQFINGDFIHATTARKMWDTFEECLLFYMNTGSKVIRKYKTIIKFEISQDPMANGQAIKKTTILETYDIKECVRKYKMERL